VPYLKQREFGCAVMAKGAVWTKHIQSIVHGLGGNVLKCRTLHWTKGTSLIGMEYIFLCLGLKHVLDGRQRGTVGEGPVL